MTDQNPYLQYGINSYQNASESDSPLRKGIALYGKLIIELEKVKEAISQKDINLRLEHVKNAEKLVSTLRLGLDFDAQDEIVEIFDQVYQAMIQCLNEVIIFDKPEEAVELMITDVKKLKEQFEKIDQDEATEDSDQTKY